MSWEQYYEKNKGRPLRALYSQAISLAESGSKCAVDLGCGIGTESLDLLERGFEVYAVDQEPKAIEILQQSAEKNQNNLYSFACSMESWEAWPQADFLFAYHSFPFCKKSDFDSVLDKAIFSISSNGIFGASFFGYEDQWVTEEKVTGISGEELRAKLHNFSVLHFEETKKIGMTALQVNKFWHVIEIIARKL